MKSKYLLKGIMRVMTGDRETMLLVLFWILEELVEDPETNVDDNTLDLLKKLLGFTGDTSELRK